MAKGRRTGAIPLALAALLVVAVIGDTLWRARPHGRARPSRAVDSVRVPLGAVESSASAHPGTPAGAAARAALRERIRAGSTGTYLVETITQGDSTIRHWAPRAGRPIRVAVVPSSVRGFREDFPGAVQWALTRWNGVGIPVQFETVGDSAGADVVVVWVDTLGAERAGSAEVTWNGAGEIVRVRVILATHAPDGGEMLTREMVTMALHELGHALGLGHSPDPADALHPTSAATELTSRDRRTTALLYSLPTGSLKQ